MSTSAAGAGAARGSSTTTEAVPPVMSEELKKTWIIDAPSVRRTELTAYLYLLLQSYLEYYDQKGHRDLNSRAWELEDIVLWIRRARDEHQIGGKGVLPTEFMYAMADNQDSGLADPSFGETSTARTCWMCPHHWWHHVQGLPLAEEHHSWDQAQL